MRKRSAMVLAVLAAATAMTGIMSPTAVAEPGPDIAADCGTLASIADNAVSTLTPLQGLPLEESQAAKENYIGQLRGRLGELTTDRGRADVQNFINALQTATTPADAYLIINALGKLRSDCA
ncbi:hypothetical protein [Nocardia sp. NPDC005366]|uniref:hypothetical protein n=1 Tax=Nocardia sp. NPDC005366 TaxID=3156878 RepID=UPI0033A940A4